MKRMLGSIRSATKWLQLPGAPLDYCRSRCVSSSLVGRPTAGRRVTAINVTRKWNYRQYNTDSENSGISQLEQASAPYTTSELHRSDWEHRSMKDFVGYLDYVDSGQLRGKFLCEAIAILKDYSEQNRSGASGEKQFFHAIGMQRLLRAIKSQVQKLEPPVQVTAVIALTKLGIRGNHPTYEALLNQVLENVSTLDNATLKFLSEWVVKLKNEDRSVYTFALKKLLPVVIENRISKLKETTSISKLLPLFAVVAKQNNVGACSDILNHIVRKRPEEMTGKELVNVLVCLSECPRGVINKSMTSFIDSCFSTLCTKMEEITFGDLSSLLRMMSNVAVANNTPALYISDICDAVTPLVLQKGNKKYILGCGRYYVAVGYLSVEFLENCAEIIASDPSLILNDDDSFGRVLNVFASFVYKPENWDVLQQIFANHPVTAQVYQGSNLTHDVTMALNFLMLDIFPHTLLERIFSNAHNWEKFLKSPYSLNLLYSAVTYLLPDYSGSLPSPAVVERWRNILRKKYHPRRVTVEQTLSAGLGGEGYQLGQVFHEGFVVDHCIVMRRGGIPVLLSDRTTSSLRDIERPENSELIMICVPGAAAFIRNEDRLRGMYDLQKKILEQHGHCIYINASTWENLNESQKTPYLMKLIQNCIGAPNV